MSKYNYNPHMHHRRSIRLKGYDYSKEGLYYVTICVQHKKCLFGEVVNGIMHLNDAGKMVEVQWLAIAERFINVRLHEYVIMPNHFHAIIEITTPETTAAPITARVKPKTFHPEPIITDTDKPDTFHPETEKTATVKPDTHHPEPIKTDTDKPDTYHTEPIKTDNVKPDTFHPEPIKTDTDKPETFHPELIITDTDKPDTYHPEPIKTDTNKTETPVGAALVAALVAAQNRPPPQPEKKTLGAIMGAFQSIITVEYIRGVKSHHWPSFKKRLLQRDYFEQIIRDYQAYINISNYIINNPKKWSEDGDKNE